MSFLPASRRLTVQIRDYLGERRFDPCSPPLQDTSWPGLTIITPSFNQARFLERTLISIHNQAYPNLQHIVVDGGSTDGSVEIIRRYEKRLSYWHSRPDGGHVDAINSGASFSTGSYMTWINSDDLLLPGALEKVGRTLLKDPSLDLVYGNEVEIDEFDRVTKRVYTIDFDMGHFLYDLNIIFPQQSSFWRVELFREMGGLTPCPYAMDYDLFYRFMKRGVRQRRLTDFLSAFRVYPSSLTGSGEVKRNRDATLDRIFEDWTGRPRSLTDRTLRRYLYKARRFLKEPRAFLAAAEHRIARMISTFRPSLRY